MVTAYHRNFVLAASAAVLGHIALLSLSVKTDQPSSFSRLPINVSLTRNPAQAATTKPLENRVKELAEKPIQATRRQVTETKTVTRVDPTRVLTKEQDSEQTETGYSTLDSNFKLFIENELERDKLSRPSAAQSFDDTFAPNFQVKPTPPEIKYPQRSFGGGQYKVYANGNVSCVLHMVQQSFDEMNGYGFIGAAKDCTPKKSLELNLRANTLK